MSEATGQPQGSEPTGDPGRPRSSWIAERWRLLRERSADAARVIGFGAGVLWEGSPLLTAALLALSGATGVAPLLQVWATRHLIDGLTRIGRVPGGGPDTASGGVLAPVLPWLALLIGVMVLATLTAAVTPLLSAHLNERVSEILDRRLYRKALWLRLAAFETPEFYDRLERARPVTGGWIVRALGVVRELLAGVIAAAGITWIVGSVHPWLALLLLAGAVPIAIIGARMSEEFTRINYRQSPLKRKLAYWRDLSTKREPAAELRLFQIGNLLLERWRSIQEDLLQELFAARRRFAGRQIAFNWVTAVLDGLVIAGLVLAAASGAITAGTLVATLYALRQFAGFRSGFWWQIDELSRFYAVLRFVPEYLETPGEERGSGSPAPESLRHGIVFENVSFTYPGAAEPAIRQVTLHIRPGERLALVGENGAGKSTLARLLLGLYEPTEGRILVDGVDLCRIDPSSWRARAGAVFQSFVHYQLTARENIGFGDMRRLHDRVAIEAAARRSGAHEVIEALPSGYDTLLGKGYEGAQELSIGQWQKLALARAYLRDAQLLVLDEPAASLDALAELEVYRQFSAASEGKTVLLISHRLGSARLADRIVFLDQGRIVQSGCHEELIAAGGPYAEMYEMQAEWYREPAAARKEGDRNGAED